ncbi:NAD(P)H-dependent oxidoreductase [Pelomonas sp. CA6]|uniref:FMN-dependent NADH-azoreductase n=1 Tax=Pelomonas sp. CA6 TaxID=2907999 RepID=UPI001F4B9181|nr:NAD(P)H-dependent oxidoreductase [Pelomonas sp. CA6]MCH7341991.1 NAD(P)H-dependent oxidoreductase [Pelomonas sp. CA6]
MPSLLHVAASPHGADSRSARAGAALVAHLRGQRADLALRLRDLARDPPPHPDAAFAAASLADAAQRSAEQHPALALSEALIAELEAADALLITTPMHNYAPPSMLKAWVDLVLRPGRSFAGSPQGKKGLLRDRPVWLLVSCGGQLQRSDGRGPWQPDWVTPYLREVLATLGLHRVQALVLEGAHRGPEVQQQAQRALDGWIAAQRWD